MATLEEQFSGHVDALERICHEAAQHDPSVSEALHGHLERALDDLDAIQDVLSDLKEDATATAEGTPTPAAAEGGE